MEPRVYIGSATRRVYFEKKATDRTLRDNDIEGIPEDKDAAKWARHGGACLKSQLMKLGQENQEFKTSLAISNFGGRLCYLETSCLKTNK